MRVTVTRAAAAAARRGHPWIFRDGIPRPPRALPSGAVVELTDDAGEALGVGLWDALSPIACRIYGIPAGEPLDTRNLLGLVARAAESRERWFVGTDTTAYRLCNGEGDRLPGLVLDRYDHVAVLRIDGEALFAWVPRLVGGLMDLLRPLGVRTLVRRLRREETGEDRTERLAGEPMPPRVVVKEHGMAMVVDLAEGQKTGAFLDQRENRRRVRGLAKGRVLNLFSYAGGFSVAAALGGASHVTSVDLAAAAPSRRAGELHAQTASTLAATAGSPRTRSFSSRTKPNAAPATTW
jgi:23S rRNA (cytosine1962-C5)-methyltransferase